VSGLPDAAEEIGSSLASTLIERGASTLLQ